MKLARIVPLVAALAVFATGCGESDPADVEEGFTIADLVGSWTASSHRFTNNANAAESYDLIANGGETRSTVLAGGGARTWVEWGPISDEWDAQLSISGNTLNSNPVEATREVRTWTFTLQGPILTLTDATSSFDFTLTGAAEVSATEVIVFVRQ
jgi:hypothetical protein